MTPLLKIEDLNYSYGVIHVLKDVSMYVNEGETVAIIGSNGAGKTTTLSCISGIVPAKGKKGQILFDGKDISNLMANKIAGLGITHVFEGRRVFAKLTVEENLEVGGFLTKDKKNLNEEIKNVYKKFPRLEERKNQLAGTLSGGEQQMLAIGRALVAKPRIILFDEPSLGLAPLIVKDVFEAIKEIKKEGTTIILVEQNSKLALKTADRAYVLKNGEVAISGDCKDLLENPDVQKVYLGNK